MLTLLPGPLVLLISAGLTILFTALCASLILLVSLAKLLLPIPAFGRACSRLNNRFMRLWLACNALVIRLTTRIDWQVEDDTRLRKDGWYLIISNHMSWTDIVVLGHLFRDRLPVPKFFMKHELIYIPLLGLACWGSTCPLCVATHGSFAEEPAPAGRTSKPPATPARSFATSPPLSSTSWRDPLHRGEARRLPLPLPAPDVAQGGRAGLHPGGHGRAVRQPDQRHHQLPG